MPKKSTVEIAREWDAISSIRAQQLADGVDVSYDSVLVPTVRRLLGPQLEEASILDVGCGTGVLTAQLAPYARRTVAVDPSPASILEAQRHAKTCGVDDVEWHPAAVEDFADSTTEQFDCIVANMTLMDAPDLAGVLNAVSKLAATGARFVWTVTHPWFWPKYWGYESAPWFKYKQEQFIEAEFKISFSGSGLSSTHIHRPLEQYMVELGRGGFVVDAIEEPMPEDETMAKYPRPWDYPRFLAVRCVRLAEG